MRNNRSGTQNPPLARVIAPTASRIGKGAPVALLSQSSRARSRIAILLLLPARISWILEDRGGGEADGGRVFRRNKTTDNKRLRSGKMRIDRSSLCARARPNNNAGGVSFYRDGVSSFDSSDSLPSIVPIIVPSARRRVRRWLPKPSEASLRCFLPSSIFVLVSARDPFRCITTRDRGPRMSATVEREDGRGERGKKIKE
jgi:hypothetical protein